MAGKARVHELAKELGVTSKEVLARLERTGRVREVSVRRPSRHPSLAVCVSRSADRSPRRRRPQATALRAAGRKRRPPGRRRLRRPRPPTPGSGPKPAARRPRRFRARRPAAPGPSAPAPAAGRRSPPAGGRSRSAEPRARPRPRATPAPGPGPAAQARRAYPARRQQPLLLAAAGRAARSRGPPAHRVRVVPAGCARPRPGGGPRPGAHARQHATSSTRRAARRPGGRVRPGGPRPSPGGRPATRCAVPVDAPGGGGGNYRGGGGAGGTGGGGAGARGRRLPRSVPWRWPPAAVAAVAVPVSAAAPQVPSAVPVAQCGAVASRSGRNAPSTRTCRRRSSVACGCRTATARPSGWPAAHRWWTSPRRSTPTRPRWSRRCSTSARWSPPPSRWATRRSSCSAAR